ncbi:MAG TPA: TMEM14 family protein [Cytophagaceae bacterium]|nr:TMEM14 family protein [Cytophagaceae bacterium]
MYYSLLSSLLCCYGLFLILCGIVSVIFIGMKAKTALISGGTSGGLSLMISYFASQQNSWTPYAGFFLCTALLIVFSWRSSKTLFRFAEMIRENHPETNGKGIAFLIISLMAVVTIFSLILQIVWFNVKS